MMELILPLVMELSQKHKVDPMLVLAVIQVESNFNPKAVGRSHGETGLMQLHPRYFPKTFDIEQNLSLGIKHLAQKLKQCRTLKQAAVVCYNVGATRGKMLREPNNHPYVKKVATAYAEITQNRGYTARRGSTPGYAALLK